MEVTSTRTPIIVTSAINKPPAHRNWKLMARCSKCGESLIELFKCSGHGNLNKKKDLCFFASFSDNSKIRPIRKYPNSHNSWYSACKLNQNKACKSENCDYAHNDLEKLIWNHMLEKKLKELYEILELEKPTVTTPAKVKEEKIVSSQICTRINKVTSVNNNLIVDEMPDEKFNFKMLYYNYCRICNIPFENNRNAFLQHRLQKPHLELQKLVRQFQFTIRMPPDLSKLKKEMLMMCPEFEKKSCRFKTKNPLENNCPYPHHPYEVVEWTKWHTYYFDKKGKEAVQDQKVSDCLIVNEMPKLKQAFSYYINENYQRKFYLLQSTGLSELNYDALMHGMVFNEMVSCIKLVEKITWSCYVEARKDDETMFTIKMFYNFTDKDHRFYKDQHLVDYINVVRIELEDKSIDFSIHQKCFIDVELKDGSQISIVIRTTNHCNILQKLSLAKSCIKCTLIVDRSMFYAMHYAIDYANKSFLFPPRIDCSNTIIEEALDGELDFPNGITPEQAQIIKRILKHKNGILAPPMIVYGAFGSGKTYCIAEAVRQLALKKDDEKKFKILVCTSSESASDIYFKVWDPVTRKRALKLVRTNNNQVGQENQGFQTICIVPLTKEVVEKIKEARIIVCTFYTSVLLNEDQRIAEWLTHILIDEAAQALECETIMPLTLALSNTTVVLAGDHRQISPIVYSSENYTFFGSNLSLLQRLFAFYTVVERTLSTNIINIEDFKLMLTTIHRTVGQIVDFISNNFYNGLLKSGRKAVKIGDSSIKYYPIQFIDTQSETSSFEDYDPKYISYVNQVEATAICWYIKMLTKYWPSDWSAISIGVVSSEAAQVELLRTLFQSDEKLKGYFDANKIRVDLVQNFQGWQFRVVVVSSVRTKKLVSNSNENLLYSLLINPYAINTCLTRSEELIVIFGNREFLLSVPDLYLPYRMSYMWNNLVSLCVHQNSFYSIKDCIEKSEDSFYFKDLKTYMDKKKAKKPTKEVQTNDYVYKQHIKDSILNTINIDNRYLKQNDENINSFENKSSSDDDDDDLPFSRRQNPKSIKMAPYKQQDGAGMYHETNSRDRRRRKLYSQYDALDSDDDNVNILDDDIEIEELENYMNTADENENEDTVKNFSFLYNRSQYYVTLNKSEVENCLKHEPTKYKLCKIRFENNAFTAIARSVDNENDFYYIRDRCNCGMAYNGDTVVCEILEDYEVEKSLFNSKQKRARVVFIWKRNEKFRNREFVCLPDDYEPCLMVKPLDSIYPKIYIFGTRDSRNNNKITIYNVDDANQIKTSKYHAITMHDLASNMYKVRIVHWNAFYKYPIGIVTEVLNSASTSEDGIRCLKLQYEINDTDVPDELVKEKNFKNSKHRRLDYSNVLTFTIDPNGSQDFDDAISFESFVSKDDGKVYYKIGIHIADVSEYVRKGSEVDIEAEKRTTSYYYDNRGEHMHIPMLPRVLATNYCSLVPNECRPCMSVLFIMNTDGEIVSLNHDLETNFQGKYLITKSTIKSRYRFTYEEVEFYLNKIKKHEISSTLKIFYDLSQKLKKKRYEDGQFFIEETSFEKLDFQTELVAHEAHSLIEEFMILTNSIIAEYLCEKYDFVPLRIQKSPDIDLLTDWFDRHKSLKSISFGISRYISCLKGSPGFMQNVEDEEESSISLKSLPIINTIFDKILKISEDLTNNNTDKHEKIVLKKKLQYLICNEQSYPLIANALNEIREIMDPAEYVCVSTKHNREKFRHFSVNLKSYTHFTSPIRRYLDLIVHRMVTAALNQENSPTFPYSKVYLQEMSQKCSLKAKNQREFERRLKVLTITELFKTSPIECISFIYSIEERQLNVIFPYFNNLRTKKCSKISYSHLDPSKQPRTGLAYAKSNTRSPLNDDGVATKYFETVDLEFSKRIYDIQAKSDILKLIDDTEDKPVVKISLNNLYLNHFQIDHWHNIRSMIKNHSFDDLARYLCRNNRNTYAEEMQTKTFLDVSSEVIGKKFKLEMINSQQADQTAVSKTKTIKHFNRRFMKHLKLGDVLKMQMSYSIDRGFLTPTIQLISVTNTIDFCVQHRVDPVKCFSVRATKLIKKPNDIYSDFDEYLNTWLPIMSMEAATTAILEPEDVAFIRNCRIAWSKEEACDPITKQYSQVTFGKLILEKKYCDERHLKFCEDNENELVSKIKSIPSGHPTFALSFLCVQYKNISTKAHQKRIFQSKTGSHLMKDTYTWVGHCVVTKVIDEEKTKKKLRNGDIHNYVIHIALMHSDTEIPQSLFEDLSSECTIELISKQYPDSSMEYALRSLHDEEYVPSQLAQSIILGTKKLQLDPKEVISEAEVDTFIKNCIQKSQDKIQRPNKKQLAAIQQAFKKPFSLIQGPPGTGKTVTGIVLAHCFTQLNKKFFCTEKNRLMYCSPSNKAVDVIGRFLKNRFFQDKSKNYQTNQPDSFSFVRVYSERIASSEYPHPKYFDKIISSSPKRGEHKQTDFKSNALDDNTHSDPELVDFVLHHIIRKDGKKYAEELKQYDKKFSILREFEDRVRNRTCCCASEMNKFKPYDFRSCNHARYYHHVNKEFSMHSMLRAEKQTYSKALREFDTKFSFLKFYLKRRYDPTFELSEMENKILRPYVRRTFNIVDEGMISKAMYQQLITKLIPALDPSVRVDDVDKFLNSLGVELSYDRFYNMMSIDPNVKHARQQKTLFEKNSNTNEFYRELIAKHGDQPVEDLYYREQRLINNALNTAQENAYFRYMQRAAEFKWKQVEEFEDLVLNAEKELFEKEINTSLNSNDPDSYNRLLHDAYELELKEHDIVLCTCIATSTSVLSKIKNFKQLIIDEAGMTKEPEALVPILLCKPEKVVLIGDHEQLRPIIKCQEARDLGLDQSIFERYCEKVTMLEEQYRMHDSICHFPSKQFYNGQLKTKVSNYISAVHWPGKYLTDFNDAKKSEMRVIFIDVKGQESKLAVHSNEGSENSVRNDLEIDCVEQIYKYLEDDRSKPSLVEGKDIVILSQYRAQVGGIKSRLKITDERVLTVITSQGGEWDYVILSTVRSLPDCDIDSKPTDGWRKKYLGFISDKNQVNVALTRAKKGLFIIGNKNLLKCDPIWYSFITYLGNKNSIMSIKEFFDFQKSYTVISKRKENCDK